jgi:hypothetical protein
LTSAFLKPENVVAAFTYSDGDGNWWGDVVFRKGQGMFQWGVPERERCCSEQEALASLKSTIAEIKATREDPLVAQLRAVGTDLESVELLRVYHEQFGYRWVILDANDISKGAEVLAEVANAMQWS